MGRAAVLVMWSEPIILTFVPVRHRCTTLNLTSVGRGISEEKMFKSVEGRRTTDHWYTISLPCEPAAQVSLKKQKKNYEN